MSMNGYAIRTEALVKRYGDLVALGVLHALRSAQLSVPADLSVVGFDDIDMACHANPPLTTISPPKYDMGRRAVDLLLARDLQSSPITEYLMIESPLVVRESTGACPVSGSSRLAPG